MTKKSIIDTNEETVVYLLSKDEVELQFGEAAASAISTDQVVSWAKFVLTDDKPNENGQRIPQEEFDNLIRTGVYKPVKMALGEIKDGHEDARPLGVITNLTQIGNKIVALAALWDHERTEDVAHIKELVNSNKPVNVSWEIFYGDTRVTNGISDLLDTALRAATIVGMPAYAGRTQLLAVAAKKWSTAYIEKLPDTSFLLIGNDGKRYFAYRDEAGKIDVSRFTPILEEIAATPLPENTLKGVRHQVRKLQSVIQADAGIQELLMDGEDFILEDTQLDTKELEGKLSDLEAKLAVANNTLAAKEKELSDALALAETANKTVTTLQEELTPLREFKLEADKVAERQVTFAAIKAKFAEANLTRSEEYFTENAEKLLGMSSNDLDFMLQELAAFKSSDGKSEASVKAPVVPNIQGEVGISTISDLATALRARNKK
jgi:hypothetical protein